MNPHIKFDAIDCDDLQFVEGGECYVCLNLLTEIADVDFCMQCRFAKLRYIEAAIRRERDSG